MDAYKGYHQIHMHNGDEKKMSFHKDRGTFCYIKMSFGLRNAGVTYKRLAYKVFNPQLGRNIEVYVDEMVIKIKNDNHFLQDIEETFANLRTLNMKLNQQKCIFGMEEGKFIGHVITKDGIKENSKKIDYF